jgi:hypothetical protein
VLPPLSDPASRIKGFPRRWWWDNTGSAMTMPPRRKRRPRASPSPASSRAFAPAPPLAPKITKKGRLEPPLAAPPTRGESNLVDDEGGALTTVPPPPSVGLDGGGPVRRRRPAGHWHHHDARRPELPGAATPLAAVDPAPQARPSSGSPRASPALPSMGAGAPPPAGRKILRIRRRRAPPGKILPPIAG